MARDNDMASELSNLSMQAPAKVMVQSARYFEDKGQFDQAAKLYQRGGNMSRALELCFAHNRFQALREIADELSADTDPALLKKVREGTPHVEGGPPHPGPSAPLPPRHCSSSPAAPPSPPNQYYCLLRRWAVGDCSPGTRPHRDLP